MGQSWSGIKKRLEEDLLCDSLKGRVRYFITKYRNSHDESGRVSIIVDGKEIIQGNIFRYYKGYREFELEYKNTRNIPRRKWNGSTFENDIENREAEADIDNIRLDDGIFDVWQFTDAVDKIMISSIHDSIDSPNPLVRLLAVMDRRTGIRTLEKMMPMVEEQPEWLRFFYLLRLHSEGLIRGPFHSSASH